jgi:uncharacterized membrane protein
LPIWIHEWIVAPVALALALCHASRALGARRAVLEAAVLIAYGFALEWTAMAVFSAYRYNDAWTVAPARVPVAIAVMWAAIILAAMALSVRMGARSPRARAATAAALAIALDLLMEPTASRLGLWRWTPPGPWLEVPIGNFVGWAVLVGGYTVGAERWTEESKVSHALLRRLVLGVASIVGLVLIGRAWLALHAETLFAADRGWWAWGALALAPVLLSLSRGSIASAPGTLAGRLGRAPGPIPVWIFALIVAAFVLDVARLGGVDLVVVAAGTCASLAVALRRVLFE